MPKTKVYEPEFKKKIVQLYLEEGRTIKSLNEEFQLGDGTVRKWVRPALSIPRLFWTHNREPLHFRIPIFMNGRLTVLLSSRRQVNCHTPVSIHAPVFMVNLPDL